MKTQEELQSEGIGRIMGKNFLAGVMRGIGAAFGYLIIAGLLVLIARKLGFFDSIQDLLNQITELTNK